MKISRHASMRLKARAGNIDPRMLWNAGREASDSDLDAFPCARYDNREYRLCIWAGHTYLMSRSTACNELITVIRKDDR